MRRGAHFLEIKGYLIRFAGERDLLDPFDREPLTFFDAKRAGVESQLLGRDRESVCRVAVECDLNTALLGSGFHSNCAVSCTTTNFDSIPLHRL